MALTISSHFTHAPRGDVLPKLLSELQNSRTPEFQNSPISPKAIVFYLPVTP